MATIAPLQPTKVRALEPFYPCQARQHDPEDLIDLDDPPPPQPAPVQLDFKKPPRRLFANDGGEAASDLSTSMEGVEHHRQSPKTYEPEAEDLIDMGLGKAKETSLLDDSVHASRAAFIDMTDHEHGFEKLSVQGAPRAPKDMIGANATPLNAQRNLIIPRGPSRRLERSDPRAHRDFITHQRSWEVEARAYRAYKDWDNMPDDRRRGYRGGGDRYRGGYPPQSGGGRKRRYDDEDDHEQQRYGRERREPLSTRVRKQIIGIADAPSRDPAEDVAVIATMISDNHEDEHFISSLKQNLPALVGEQPLKISHVAAILLYLDQKKPEITSQILETFGSRAQLALEEGDWRSLKLLLRLFALTHSLYEGDGVFAVLEELFNRVVDLQAASSDDAVGIELVKVIMLTIPYAVSSRVAGINEKAAELLEKTGLVASAESAAEKVVNPYVTIEGQEAPQLPKVISLLQTQLENEAGRDWPLAFLPKLFKPASADGEADSSVSTQKHTFPALAVPTTVNPGPRPLFLEVYFSIYADQEVETVPKTSDLAASLIRDALVDTINIMDFNRIMITRYLIDIDQYFAPDTFAKRATPFDIIRNNEAGAPCWKPEDVAIDAIFSQLLKLPAPEHKPVYYHSLITEACKDSPAAFAPCLGRLIRFLYQSTETLDLELSYRYMDWFSHHLSNYDHRWKWVEWTGDVGLSRLHPKNAFIRGALSKEIRLAFAKRIRDVVPSEYHKLIPASMDNDIPNFKYSADETPFAPEARKILTHLRQKAADSEISPFLDSITTQTTEQTTQPNAALPAIDAYVTSLCYIGSKSLSHVLSFIERNKDRLLSFSRDAPSPAAADAARTQIISSVVEYWRDTQAGVAVGIVDKLLNYGIISPGSVIAWALGTSTAGDNDDIGVATSRKSADPRTVLPESWMYEMVAGTLAKVINRVRQIVAARAQQNLPPPQAAALDETLTREMADMRVLFGVVEDALSSVAIGSDDVMIEEGVGDDTDGGAGNGTGGGPEEMKLMKQWGIKWVRVFGRKRAVEEKVVGEAVARFPPPGPEVEEVVMQETEPEAVNGAVANGEDAAAASVNGNGNAAPASNGGLDTNTAADEGASLLD